MVQRRVRRIVWILLAFVSVGISVLSGFGVILGHDTVGRILFAVAWGAVAVAWLGRYFAS